MFTQSTVGRLALSTVTASLLLGISGCAHQAPPLAPALTSAEIAPAPLPPPAPTPVVSMGISVSDELTAACKLTFNNIDEAPKFDFDESVLGSQDADILTQVAKCLTTGPLTGRGLALVGRADPRGESEYNMALGERRASSVRDYLSSLGIDGTKLTLSSRGKLDATGTDDSGWQRDRRVDVVLH